MLSFRESKKFEHQLTLWFSEKSDYNGEAITTSATCSRVPNRVQRCAASTSATTPVSTVTTRTRITSTRSTAAIAALAAKPVCCR